MLAVPSTHHVLLIPTLPHLFTSFTMKFNLALGLAALLSTSVALPSPVADEGAAAAVKAVRQWDDNGGYYVYFVGKRHALPNEKRQWDDQGGYYVYFVGKREEGRFLAPLTIKAEEADHSQTRRSNGCWWH
jgi:hypothetical protein